MERDEWLQRCSARFKERSNLDATESNKFAEAMLEFFDGDLTEDPEKAADEDMSNWDNDE